MSRFLRVQYINILDSITNIITKHVFSAKSINVFNVFSEVLKEKILYELIMKVINCRTNKKNCSVYKMNKVSEFNSIL